MFLYVSILYMQDVANYKGLDSLLTGFVLERKFWRSIKCKTKPFIYQKPCLHETACSEQTID